MIISDPPFFLSHPGYFGKVGMRHFHFQKNQYHSPSINVEKLWTLVSEQTKAKYAKSGEKDKVPVIDVTRAVRSLLVLMYFFAP